MMVKKLILLVEDEIEQATRLASLIEASGQYSVLLAHDGRQALDQVEKHSRFLGFAKNKIKTIILDLKMPNMNGVQFLKELRKQEYFATRMPIIVLSAYEDKEKWQDVTDEHDGYACEYSKKPVNVDDLLNILKRIHGAETEIMIQKTREKARERKKELQDVPIETL